MSTAIRFLPGFLILFILSGCMYPGNREAQHTVYKTQIQSVQKAVDQYQKKTGVLPIKTRDQKTPLYLKNPIQFSNKLVPLYLPEPPTNAYANGGVYTYVIVNPDKDPTVKAVDMRIVQKVQTLQRRLNVYIAEHNYPPFSKVIVDGRYTLDYKKLGYDTPPIVKSPFTGKDLGFVMGTGSNIHIDYRKDLYAYLQKYENDYKNGDDIREILVKHSPFVPVYSFPYTVKENEPIFLVK